MQIESYKQLLVWQRAIELVIEVYQITKALPKSELYSLVTQIRRSAISIPSNIAEGYKRRNLGDYIRFLCIADASAAELETQLLITKLLYPAPDLSKADLLLSEVQKMLTVVIQKLKAKRQLIANP